MAWIKELAYGAMKCRPGDPTGEKFEEALKEHGCKEPGSGSGGSGGGSGGGSVAVSPKEVNFYDYDGTCVHAYTVAEAQAMSELPAGPEHPGLVFQGWNWSLEGVKGLTRAMNIGAMYTTDDGTTRLYITLQEGRTSPMLGVGVSGTVTVDWGDGTEPDVLTGTSIYTAVWTPNHAYAAPGDYVIRLTVDGQLGFTGSSTSGQDAGILRNSSGTDSLNCAYQSALKKIEIGENVAQIGSNAFCYCYCLGTLTIPDGLTAIKGQAFYNCSSLIAVTIPISVQTISDSYIFNNCRALKVANMPHGLKYIGGSMFNTCDSLKTAAIPNGVGNIGDSAYANCRAMVLREIPEGVTKISVNAFSGCTGFVFVKIPDSVTNISGRAFDGCKSVACYDFTSCADIPALSATNVFAGIPADCEIRVPAALYDEWIAATNWATYAANIKAY